MSGKSMIPPGLGKNKRKVYPLHNGSRGWSERGNTSESGTTSIGLAMKLRVAAQMLRIWLAGGTVRCSSEDGTSDIDDDN